MVQLQQTFKLTIAKAAYMVSKLPDSHAQNTLEHRFKKDKFWKSQRKILERIEDIPLKSIEAQKEFLKQFSYYCLPDQLKPLHPKPRT